MSNEKTETRVRQSYKAREVERITKGLEAWQRMQKHLASNKRASDQLDVLLLELAKLQNVVSALPDDFAPETAKRLQLPEKGDDVTLNDELRAAYGVAKGATLKVEAVNRIGEGRGSKVLVRLRDAKGNVIVANASHLE